jgi:hypothetical protein
MTSFAAIVVVVIAKAVHEIKNATYGARRRKKRLQIAFNQRP